MKAQFEEADELDGFEDLNDEDQERIKKAWDDGHVAPEDIPETAKKGDGEEEEDDDEEKPKKRGGKKKEEDTGPGVFKLEYASSGRSKCKGASRVPLCQVVSVALMFICDLDSLQWYVVRLSTFPNSVAHRMFVLRVHWEGFLPPWERGGFPWK